MHCWHFLELAWLRSKGKQISAKLLMLCFVAPSFAVPASANPADKFVNLAIPKPLTMNLIEGRVLQAGIVKIRKGDVLAKYKIEPPIRIVADQPISAIFSDRVLELDVDTKFVHSLLDSRMNDRIPVSAEVFCSEKNLDIIFRLIEQKEKEARVCVFDSGADGMLDGMFISGVRGRKYSEIFRIGKISYRVDNAVTENLNFGTYVATFSGVAGMYKGLNFRNYLRIEGKDVRYTWALKGCVDGRFHLSNANSSYELSKFPTLFKGPDFFMEIENLDRENNSFDARFSSVQKQLGIYVDDASIAYLPWPNNGQFVREVKACL